MCPLPSRSRHRRLQPKTRRCRLPTHTRLHLYPFPPTPADAIASGMASYAASTNNLALGEAAATMALACDASSVPKPPTSFDYISACVNTVMETLNATTFAA